MRNAPALASIVADPDMLKSMDLPYLADLLAFADATKKEADDAGKLIKAAVLARLKDPIKAAYDAKGSDTGTVHVVVHGLDFEVNTPKKVEWDQAKLAEVSAKIAAGGDDPSEYIKVERKVEEKAYTSWPSFLRKQFEPARTLKPGNPALTVSEAVEAVAA
jgi:hypothetical protein